MGKWDGLPFLNQSCMLLLHFNICPGLKLIISHVHLHPYPFLLNLKYFFLLLFSFSDKVYELFNRIMLSVFLHFHFLILNFHKHLLALIKLFNNLLNLSTSFSVNSSPQSKLPPLNH
jgi:hypothetical protein